MRAIAAKEATFCWASKRAASAIALSLAKIRAVDKGTGEPTEATPEGVGEPGKDTGGKIGADVLASFKTGERVPSEIRPSSLLLEELDEEDSLLSEEEEQALGLGVLFLLVLGGVGSTSKSF